MNQKKLLSKDLINKQKISEVISETSLNTYKISDVLYRKMLVRGKFLINETIYLENRPYPSKNNYKNVTTGFCVLTPMRLIVTGKILWIYRGWYPRNTVKIDYILPKIQTSSEIVEIQGVIYQHPPRIMNLGGEFTNSKIQQNFDIQKEEKRLGISHLPFVLYQSSSSHDGLIRILDNDVVGYNKHLGYAIQWFFLAALGAVLLMHMFKHPFYINKK